MSKKPYNRTRVLILIGAHYPAPEICCPAPTRDTAAGYPFFFARPMYSTNKYYNVSYNIPNPQTPVCLRTTATPLPSPFRCYRPISPAVLPPVASGRGRYLSAERIWKVLLFARHLKSRSGSFFPQRVFFGPSAAYLQDSQLANFSTIVWFTLIRCRRRATRAFDPHQFAISAPAALPGGMLM